MANDSQEFETKPSSNKDLWLFLIVLDVVFLCVFGFFLYKHFSVQLFNSPSQPATPVVQETTPEVVEEVVTVTEEPVAQLPAPQETAQPEKTPVVEEVVTVVEPAPVEVPMAHPEPANVKKSIIVTPTSGKYRRVTFRWFEPAETVAIVSGFTNRKPQALKKIGDYWETTLSIAPGTYKFLYVVDGKNTLDPNAQEKDGRSVLIVE